MNHNFDVDGLDHEITIDHVAGVEGPSVYVAGYRVAGPKPWGGGRSVHEWKTTPRDILEALVGRQDQAIGRIEEDDAAEWHREYRRRQTPLLIAALEALAARPEEAPKP